MKPLPQMPHLKTVSLQASTAALLQLLSMQAAVAKSNTFWKEAACPLDASAQLAPCTVETVSASGAHLLLSSNSRQFLYSRASGRVRPVGLRSACTRPSEGEPICIDPGRLVSAEFVTINGIVLADLRYSRAPGVKATLCGRNVPLDYNAGPRPSGIAFLKEAANLGTEGDYEFIGDPALRTTYEINRVRVENLGTEVIVWLNKAFAFDGTSYLYRWEPQATFDAPDFKAARFGTASCYAEACLSSTIIGERFQGKTQALVIESSLGKKAYFGQGIAPMALTGNPSAELVILPNGSVDGKNDTLCTERD